MFFGLESEHIAGYCCICLFSFLVSDVCFQLLLTHLRIGNLLLFFFLIFFFALIIKNISDLRNVSGETCGEINNGVENLTSQNDFGYLSTFAYGYPARQYFIPALPSIFWGRSLSSMNLGGSIYFLFGIIIFTSGIFSLLKDNILKEATSIFALASLLHFHFVNHFLFYFEQSIFPLSFTLILAGLYMHLTSKRDKTEIIILSGFILLNLIYSYTPSLSIYVLTLPIGLFLLKSKELTLKEKALFLFIFLLSIVSLQISFKLRHDINIFQLNERGVEQLVKDLGEMIDIVFWGNPPGFYSSTFFQPFFISLLASFLFFVFGPKYAFLALWMLIIIILSVISRGYTYYGVHFRLHRSIVILPIFLTMIVFLINKISTTIKPKYFIVLLLIIIFSGIQYHQKIINNRTPTYQLTSIFWLNDHIKTSSISEDKKPIYFADNQLQDFNMMNNLFEYFAPTFRDEGYRNDIFNLNCQINKNYKGIILIKNNHQCFETLKKEAEKSEYIKYYGYFHTHNDGEIYAFELK